MGVADHAGLASSARSKSVRVQGHAGSLLELAHSVRRRAPSEIDRLATFVLLLW
jgi:hypothetical protein